MESWNDLVWKGTGSSSHFNPLLWVETSSTRGGTPSTRPTFKRGKKKFPLCFLLVEVREVSVSSPALSCWGVHGIPAPLTTTCAVLPQFVNKALAHELLLSLQGGPTYAYYMALAWSYMLQEDFPRCEECLCEAVRINPLVIPVQSRCV